MFQIISSTHTNIIAGQHYHEIIADHCSHYISFHSYSGVIRLSLSDVARHQIKWVELAHGVSATSCECGADKCGIPFHSSWCPKA